MDLPDGADADALEALGDALPVEGEGGDAAGEEVRAEHRLPPGGVVLVQDREEALLEAPRAVGLGAAVAALPVIEGVPDAGALDRPVQAAAGRGGAGAQARGRAEALVHLHAGRIRRANVRTPGTA